MAFTYCPGLLPGQGVILSHKPAFLGGHTERTDYCVINVTLFAIKNVDVCFKES